MSAPRPPSLPCLCASLRRTSRKLTQIYEEALRPVGLRATQFTVLQFLSLAGEVSQLQLGQMLAMDSTTLTRTLTILHRHGWIAKHRGKDRREWRLGLSRSGEKQLQNALPYWEKLQADLRTQLGNQRWDQWMQMTHDLTTILAEATIPN